MELKFLNKEFVSFTPFVDLHYELRDGSVLRAKGFISIRQEWFTKSFHDFTDDDFTIVLKYYFKQWFSFEVDDDYLKQITGR